MKTATVGGITLSLGGAQDLLVVNEAHAPHTPILRMW
jgi:hypothetical protein